MKKALLVIDMQEVFVGKEQAAIFKYQNDELIAVINTVIDDNQDNLVIYIKNLMKKNLVNKLAPFKVYEGSKEAELVETLHVISNHVFVKYTGDAFSNQELDQFLKQADIEVVEVIGVDGGGCVALSALGAIEKGYKVIVNTKAIGTVMEKKKVKYFKKLEELDATIF